METNIETKQLYLDDSYQKDFEAVITRVIDVVGTNTETNDNSNSTTSINSTNLSNSTYYVVLNQTLFYPKGGGQSSDTGILECNNVKYIVTEVIKREGVILHKILNNFSSNNFSSDGDAPKLCVNQSVHGTINWDRRYMLMRMHTAAHLIDAVLYKDNGILATGNELGCDKSRIDFNMPNFSMDKVEKYISEANDIIEKDLEVKNYYLSKEKAFKISGIVKLAGALPPDIPILRITEIVGLDIQADGGTHVRHLKEIGKITILSIENKGKERKRICYTLQNQI